MNIPFDDDYNVMPEPPSFDEGEPEPYNNFPSAVGRETVPADWTPRSGRELPALRCTFEKLDGERCKNFGIRGTGFNGTPALCKFHGGSLPAVKEKAEATLLAARMKLVSNVDLAVDTLLELTKPGTSESIRLKASTELLDRVGVKGGIDLNVNVTTDGFNHAEEIAKKLQIMRDRINPPEDLGEQDEILDAEEVDTEETID